jgi:hypothetical protein
LSLSIVHGKKHRSSVDALAEEEFKKRGAKTQVINPGGLGTNLIPNAAITDTNIGGLSRVVMPTNLTVAPTQVSTNTPAPK